MKEETKTESPKYTTVIHSVRIELDLSLNEYCLADIIYNLSNNPSSRFSGWCYASKETLSKFLGVTSRTVFEMIERLISKDLIQKENDTKWLKTTSKWYELVVLEKLKIKPTTYEETAQPMKKVHSTYEETSYPTYEESSYNKNNSYNDINKSIINSEPSSQPDEVNLILQEFYKINPTLNFGNKTQRKAVEDLIKMFTAEKLILMIQWYATQTSNTYCPVATNPLAFKNKIAEIKMYADKLKTPAKGSITRI